MTRVLEDLASDVGVSERTLRRAVTEGVIRAHRPTPHDLDVPPDERYYVRTHWATLAALRRALRTEPAVRCAVLFGSAARGEDEPESDLDVMVWLRPEMAGSSLPLMRRLAKAVERNVQVFDADELDGQATMLASVLRDGRVLVDRDGSWERLQRAGPEVRRTAARERRENAARGQAARDFFRAADDA